MSLLDPIRPNPLSASRDTGKAIDRADAAALHGSRRKAPNPRVDLTAWAIDASGKRVRAVLPACGKAPRLEGKANGAPTDPSTIMALAAFGQAMKRINPPQPHVEPRTLETETLRERHKALAQPQRVDARQVILEPVLDVVPRSAKGGIWYGD